MEPIISVKIPTYNCANYLIQTIASVLNQKDFDLDLLDIEVIDDYSTLDDPESVVKQYGKNRVKFYQNSKNIGAVNTFNTCIERSNCKFIHILHGDDYIESNFYSEIYKMIVSQDAELFSTRCYMVNESSSIVADSNIILNTNLDNFKYHTPIQFASVIFSTSLAKSNGGFDDSLIHLNDRDMWLRLTSVSKWVHSNKILANYRVFEGNDSSKLIKTGKNLLDYHRFYDKHADNLNLSTAQIHTILFNMYINQSLILSNSDLNSNRLIIKSILGRSYINFLIRSQLKSLIKKIIK